MLLCHDREQTGTNTLRLTSQRTATAALARWRYSLRTNVTEKDIYMRESVHCTALLDYTAGLAQSVVRRALNVRK